MSEKMEGGEREFYELDRFGCMSGFDFTSGGNAVIHMETPEVKRFLQALIDIEKAGPKPSEEIVAALTAAKGLIAKRHLGRARSPEYLLEAVCPIARIAARCVPVLSETMLKSEAQEDGAKVKKSRLSEKRAAVLNGITVKR